MTDANAPILTNLPILPLKRTVLFPGTMMPLTVGRDRSIAAVEAALKTEDKTLLVVAQRDAQTDQPTLEDLYTIGTKAVIKQTARTPEGHYNILIQGLERFVLLKLDQVDPYLQARVKQLPPPSERSTEVEALHRAILDIITELPKLIQTPGVHEAVAALGTEEDPVVLAYRIASLLNLTLDGEQQLLEASTRADLLRGLYAALSREVQILQLRDKITSEAREKLGKTQREYLLREQLKTIQQELGESNGEEDEVAALRKKVQDADLPEHVRKETDRELTRLAKTPSAS
ncbi:MAG TPA: LON peptidase substrate-binding domain-containing protein, partial [Nitrospira sp.]|nr:LON peptidase substrate-binding domain-containing protein [Nitrospira sp.]